MFGKLVKYHVEWPIVYLEYEKRRAQIEIMGANVINVFAAYKYKDHFSRAIENRRHEGVSYDCQPIPDGLQIKTTELIIKIYDNFKVDFYNIEGVLLCEDYRGARSPFKRRGGLGLAEEEGHHLEADSKPHSIEVIKTLFGDEKFYGFGEKTGPLDKRGYSYEMWNTDDPKPHVESHKALYKSVPFFVTLRDSGVFGIFFDNTFLSYFDMAKENPNYYYFGADDGNLDYYFIGSSQMAGVVSGYTQLTGTTPLPQLWTLGYQQSRFSYLPESRVRELAANFRKNDIPCDVLHLDIDYMDQFKVFTWDSKKFPEHKRMIADLKEDGFKTVTIIDPGVKKEKGYSIYDQGMKKGLFATDPDGVTYVNRVWPGDSVYPDYSNPETRAWWGEHQAIMLKDGVAGIWNDMNEPASFNGPLPDDVQFKNDGRPTDHTEIHNVYGHLMSKATYEGIKKHSGKRPFVITRAAFAGTQKYSTVWTGDNQSFWDHLQMAVPMLLNLSLSGFSFCGTDVGGFSFDATPELLSRWVQVGCFSPLFRNHSCVHTRDQEPWAFDETTLEINKKYIQLRYQLLPYFYDLFWSGEKTGLPVLRPLVLHYEKDKRTFQINDQFLVGEHLLIAPVLEQGKTVRLVYLPEGNWVDYWTHEVLEGGSYLIKEAPLDLCPMYVKAGSVIPKYPVQNFVGELEIKTLILDWYDGNGQYTHYVDDHESFAYQQGEYTAYGFEATSEKDSKLKITLKNEKYPSYEAMDIHFYKAGAVTQVTLNGEEVPFTKTETGVNFKISGQPGEVIIR